MNETITAKPRENRLRKKGIVVLNSFVLVSFLVPALWLVGQIARGTMGIPGDGVRPERDYVLMLLQCAAGILAVHLPWLLKRFKLEVPAVLQILFPVFLFCAIFLGEVGNFYYLVPHWDDVLHLGSGVMLGLLGCLMAAKLGRRQSNGGYLPPIAIALFGFCFAVCVGALWEVYEFVFDGLLGLNMQKTMTAAGQALAGHAAVADTMKDLVVDSAGALAAGIIGCRSAIRHSSWLYGTNDGRGRTLPYPDKTKEAA